jgi:isoquinoline 1-oxidoreductase beta subunit
MNAPHLALNDTLPNGDPVNISRRGFLLGTLGATGGALVLGLGIPVGAARAQGAGPKVVPGTRVPAFLEIRPDGHVRLQSPFMEGGQGVMTAMAQIVGEELDADPASFIVDHAPTGPDYLVVNGVMRITGGSMSVRTSYDTMRRLGAIARHMLLQAAARRMDVPIDSLTTEPGKVIHAASGRSLAYGDLAPGALDLPAPDPRTITLKDPAKFRWIGKPVARLDMHDKSTGKAMYAIDYKVDGMLHGAIQHAPRLGLSVGTIRNLDAVRAMKGVHSVEPLGGAVAVLAERYWHAKRAAESLQVDWHEPASTADLRYMPADFSTEAHADLLAKVQGKVEDAETQGDATKALSEAATVVTASYRSQFLNHGQLEPPRRWRSSIPMARWSCGSPIRRPTCSWR